MKIKVIEKQKDRIVFILEGTTEAMANTIRRVALNEVPTLAIEHVTMQRNSSALYDEVLAHRLGLIPLKTDLKSYRLQEDCVCKGKGCAQCTLTLTLKAKGPATVYSGSIESKDPKVVPAYDKMVVVKLLKDQEIRVEATAILGRGKTHMKFSPGLIFYHGHPTITIEKKSGIKACVEGANNNLVEKGNELIIKDISKWNEAHEEMCEKNGMKVTASKKNFIMSLESWGHLSPKEILMTATDIVDRKLDEFAKQFKKI